jgi:hypothetical protein
VILDVIAKDQDGKEIWKQSKEYFEIGLDWDGDRRYGAWQIKDIVDYSLPPRTTTTEKFYPVFPKEVKKATLQIKVTYRHKAGTDFVVHDIKKELDFTK